ncbi:MAG: hypothetical protein M3384_13095 [Acidobacteriota bacterium]|nr:hypothetical protein [Acidobacteriota bacterium]
MTLTKTKENSSIVAATALINFALDFCDIILFTFLFTCLFFTEAEGAIAPSGEAIGNERARNE